MRILPLLLLSSLALGQGQGGRDPWERLARFDEDGDGKVSRDEFRGPERFFDRMDADKDGFVTKEEAQNMRRGRGDRQRGRGADMLLRRMDTDGDGAVSKQEWEVFFKQADENGDEILQAEELRAAASGRAMRDDAPKVGDAAPKVSAVSSADGRKVDLGAPKRPTVLVFGSWT